MNNYGSIFEMFWLFLKLDILPIPCEYVFCLLLFLIKDFDNFLTDTALHSVNTRTKH